VKKLVLWLAELGVLSNTTELMLTMRFRNVSGFVIRRLTIRSVQIT